MSLAYVARFVWGWFAFTEDPALSRSAYVIAGVIWMAAILRAMAARELYDEDTLIAGGGEQIRLWRSLLEGVAILAILAFFVRNASLSRTWFLLSAATLAVFLPFERVWFRRALARARRRGRFHRPVVLVAKPRQNGEPEASGSDEFDLIERVSPEDLRRSLSERADLSGWGAPDEVAFLVEAADCDEEALWTIVLEAGGRGYSVFVMSILRAVPTDRMTMRDLSGRTAMRVLPPRISGMRAAGKRGLDLVGVLLLSPFALVLGLVVVLAQLASSGRPVFYGQERLGRDMKVFRMWKFRSMKIDAEDETGPVWAEKDDPRRTRLGGFLRRSSLDELPQLWNVLAGDMSLVGPRPERPEFVERLSEEVQWYRYRLRIKPGLTGRAQALGFRGQSPLDSRIEQDNWYIENWSLALDLQILARTVIAVLRGTNAE